MQLIKCNKGTCFSLIEHNMYLQSTMKSYCTLIHPKKTVHHQTNNTNFSVSFTTARNCWNGEVCYNSVFLPKIYRYGR